MVYFVRERRLVDKLGQSTVLEGKVPLNPWFTSYPKKLTVNWVKPFPARATHEHTCCYFHVNTLREKSILEHSNKPERSTFFFSNNNSLSLSCVWSKKRIECSASVFFLPFTKRLVQLVYSWALILPSFPGKVWAL